MRTFAGRRLRNTGITVAVLAGVVCWVDWREQALGNASFDTGYLLLGGLLFLAMYNLRKKLPVLPLGSSSTWLQWHLYVGLAAIVVCCLHLEWSWPGGVLNTVLATLFFLTAGSGIVGLIWTRTLPGKLARIGEEVIYERIVMLRGQIRDRAHQSLLDTARSAGDATLGEFYAERLHGYFEKPRGWPYYLRPSSALRRRLLAELTEAQRYFSDPERKAAEEIFALIRKRDDLDYHEAMQWRLKVWLIVHIGLTYPLVLLACLHGWLAHRFSGGLP